MLTSDSSLRETMGRAARHAVYRDWGPWAEAAHWQTLWPELLIAGGPQADIAAERWSGDRPTTTALEPQAPGLYPDQLAAPAEAVTPALGGALTLATDLIPRYRQTSRIDVLTSTFGRPPTGELRVRLLRHGRVLRVATVEPAQISDDGWTAFEFDPLEAPGPLRLEISQPTVDSGGGVGAWRSLDGQHLQGDALRPGDLVVRTWASPTRLEIASVAMGEAMPAREPRNRTALRTVRVLWHKGRHSLRSRGTKDTAFRVMRYVQRMRRGRRRR